MTMFFVGRVSDSVTRHFVVHSHGLRYRDFESILFMYPSLAIGISTSFLSAWKRKKTP